MTRYSYDAFNQRVQRVTPAAATNFLVDPAHPSGLSQVLLESDGAGQTTATYVVAGAVPVSQDQGGHASSPVDRWSQARPACLPIPPVLSPITSSYDAFGDLLSRTGNSASPYQFNGQEFDAAAGSYHLRAGRSNPITGRFTSVDPFPGLPDRPATMHPYLFAQNDPVNSSDPSGEVTLAEVMFVTSVILTVSTTAYDLSQGNYKSAAINVGLGVIPFGALFKAVFRGGRAARQRLHDCSTRRRESPTFRAARSRRLRIWLLMRRPSEEG